MSSDDRSSIENGIWMCFTHGKLIDTDESRFTIPMLMKWKVLAELRARLSLDQGRTIDLSPKDLTDMTFAGEKFTVGGVGTGEENRIIGDALINSCVTVIWGQEPTRCIRDAMIELARNAFAHGKATQFSVEIHGRAIKLTDNGAEFDVRTLPTLASRRGGAHAIEYLLEKYSDKLVINYRRFGDENEVNIALVHTLKDVRDATPCTVTISHRDIWKETVKIEVHESCKTVYLILTPYVTVSDVYGLAQLLEKRGPDPRQFVFVIDDASESVRGLLRKMFQQYKFISVSEYRP